MMREDPKNLVLLNDHSGDARHQSVAQMLDAAGRYLDGESEHPHHALLIMRWRDRGTTSTQVFAAGLEIAGALGTLELAKDHLLNQQRAEPC